MTRGNFTTGSQRYNARMNKIFEEAKSIRKKESGMSDKDLIADGYSKETAKQIILKRKLKKMAGL